MEQLIFFGIIILFSILESVARKRKARSVDGLPDAPDLEPVEIAERYDDPPAYEAPGSRADAHGGALRAGRTRPAAAAPRSSEAVIPAELWEEIAGLVGGRGASAPAPPEPARPAKVAPSPVSPRAPQTATTAARVPGRAQPPKPHPVHLSHAGFGTDPSSRARSEQDGLDPLSRRLSQDMRQVRSVLSGRAGRHALRQAVLLQEILGPPAGLREDRPTSPHEPSS